MKYYDRIYGNVEITEPVILDLIKSPTLQRLKYIDQAGYRLLFVKPNIEIGEFDNSRFAHSLGVYILLNKYNAPIEEQIAGLIHDVSHSAFSHCIDYVLDVGSEKEQNHQDNFFDKYIRKTDIPAILKKHGFDLEYILHDKNFPLKENKLPDICADRIDYAFKTADIFEELNSEAKRYLLDNLVAENNIWHFANQKSAQKFAELFLLLNQKYFSCFLAGVMFRAVGDCLKYALQKHYITEEDLYTTDAKVINKIKDHINKDDKLRLLWDRMNNEIKATNNPKDFESRVYCKSRIIDPLFKDGEKLKRLSDVLPGWKKIINEESKPKKYFLKFEK